MIKDSKRKFLLLLFTAAFILTAAFIYIYRAGALKTGTDGQIKFLIGMSQSNLSEPWRIALNEKIREEASKHEDLKVIFTDANNDSMKQINDIEELIGNGIDLLMISPNDENLLSPAIGEINKKLPVIVLDREIESQNYTLFIGADNRKIGEDAGELIYRLLGEKGGNVIEIQGVEGSHTSLERSEGFRKAIYRHRTITLIDTIYGNWTSDRAEDNIKERFPLYSNVDVIFAHNDDMAFGAYIAAQNMRISNIKFVGIDGLSGPGGGLELVRDGVFAGTFTNTYSGEEAIKYALKILNKEKDLPKKVFLESQLVTRETPAP